MASFCFFFVLLLVAHTSIVASQTIRLPLRFGPEGITRGMGNTLFVGDVRNGAIFRTNIARNTSDVIVHPFSDRSAAGLAVKKNKLFVAGAGNVPFGSSDSANLYVYNTETGKEIVACSITGASFLNDVVIRFNKAYFTDSGSNKIFVVPINSVRQCKFETIELPAAFRPADGLPGGNGIEFFRGELLIANTAEGTIFSVDPQGIKRARRVMPTGSLTGVDGLVVKRRKLYIVDNRGGEVAVWLLRRRRATKRIFARKIDTMRSETFESPSTAAIIGDKLYVANSRFGEVPIGVDVSQERFTVSVVPLL